MKGSLVLASSPRATLICEFNTIQPAAYPKLRKMCEVQHVFVSHVRFSVQTKQPKLPESHQWIAISMLMARRFQSTASKPSTTPPRLCLPPPSLGPSLDLKKSTNVQRKNAHFRLSEVMRRPPQASTWPPLPSWAAPSASGSASADT